MVLLVDDDPRFLKQAQQTLNVGKGVLFAGSGEQAKDLISSVGEAFPVVMVDLDLRGEDGFTLIRELKEHFPDLPVIAVSGVVQPHVLESAILVGAAEALSKPISAEWQA